MDNKNTFVSVPVRFEKQEFKDTRFLKVKIYVMHDKLNFNGSYFGINAIEKAKDSIYNIPILAFVKKTNDFIDFKGHEDEVVVDGEGNMNYRYLGVPIGVIPYDTCNYRYETFDDKTYVVVDGYIWTDYANEALDVFMRDGEKSQSMEIMVNESRFDEVNGWYEILDYKYTGLCALGDDVTPAMEGAKIKIKDEVFSNFSSEYQKKVKELNDILNQSFSNDNNKEKEVENMEEIVKETTLPIEGDESKKDEKPENEDTLTVDENDGGDIVTGEEDSATVVQEEESENENQQEEQVVEENEVNEPQGDDEKEKELEQSEYKLKTQMEKILEENSKLKEEIDSLRVLKEEILKEKEDNLKMELLKEYKPVISSEVFEVVYNERENYTSEQMKNKLNEIVARDVIEKTKDMNKFSAETQGGIKMDTLKKARSKSKYAV